jgi:hypothetical protein
MADYQIESHDDDSVTLTIGPLVAHVRSNSHRSAFDSARALAGLLTTRVELARMVARVAGLRHAIGEIDSALDGIDRAVRGASEWARGIGDAPR